LCNALKIYVQLSYVLEIYLDVNYLLFVSH
jgi:hypothetical protein